LTDLGLLEALKERGYQMAELNNVLYRWLRREEEFAPGPGGLEIRRGAMDEADLWADVVGRGFFDGKQPPPEFQGMFAPLFQIPDAVAFLVWAGKTAVAGAGGLLIPERKMIAMFGAATLPDFRGRGIQSALLRRRMKLAADQHCDLAVTVTRGGTTSQRNAERLGFRLAYSKATLLKNWGKS
jgi:GNAT superfamily N-acetyltransferase